MLVKQARLEAGLDHSGIVGQVGRQMALAVSERNLHEKLFISDCTARWIPSIRQRID